MPPTTIYGAVSGLNNGLHLPWPHCRLCTWPHADAAFRPGWWETGIRGSWWQAHRRRRGWRWLCKEEVVRLWEEEGKANTTGGQLLIACFDKTSETKLQLDFCIKWNIWRSTLHNNSIRCQNVFVSPLKIILLSQKKKQVLTAINSYHLLALMNTRLIAFVSIILKFLMP